MRLVQGSIRMMMSNLSIWCLNKLVLPEDVNECQLGLHESKPHANAIARAPAEGHVAHLGTLGSLLWRKSKQRKLDYNGCSVYDRAT